ENTVDLRVSWKDGSNLKLLLPKPVSGGRFVTHDGSVHFDGVASIAHLHGIDAELLTISCAGRGYLNIELLDENPVAEKFRYLHADLPLLSGCNDKLKQISLYENYNLLNAMLACAWNSNSTLCVDFYSDRFGKDKATLSIKRYDGSFIEHDQGLLVDIKNSVVFPANRIDELVVDAISLKDPGLHISLLKKDEFAYDLSALNVQDSPWLIVGKLDGTARIAPVIKWGLPVLQTNDLLLNALCEADSEQRKKYFNELIFEIDNNPLQNYC
ncbi:TPA: STY4851/ECs_5259 family protein, partial [Escherichia coli]